MTGPMILDHPDWNPAFNSAKVLLLSINNKAIVGSDTSAFIQCGNMHSLLIELSCNTNNVELVINWFLDSAGLDLIATDQIDVLSTSVFNQTIPVKGAFVQFTAIPGPAGSCTYSATVSESPVDAIASFTSTDNILIAQDGVSIGAGATVAFDTTRSWAGPATLLAYSPDALSYDIDLVMRFHDGSSGGMFHVDNHQAITSHALYLPPVTLRINATNHDGAAKHFHLYLTAKPFYP